MPPAIRTSTPTTVRLDAETEAVLDRLATERGVSRSAVIREAIHELAALDERRTPERSVLERVADLIAVAEDGPEDLAERHKERFREKLGADREANE